MEYQILIRLSGIMLVTAGCCLTGRQLSDMLKKRKMFFRECVGLLQYLDKEMLERKAGMTEAFHEASLLCGEPWKTILKELSEEVAYYSGSTFSELWADVIRKHVRKNFLCEDEWNMLFQMARVFSGADSMVQKTLIQDFLERVNQMETKAAEEYEKKGRLYQRLSVFAAAFMILILV